MGMVAAFHGAPSTQRVVAPRVQERVAVRERVGGLRAIDVVLVLFYLSLWPILYREVQALEMSRWKVKPGAERGGLVSPRSLQPPTSSRWDDLRISAGGAGDGAHEKRIRSKKCDIK
jgi:hypothetical protein